MIVKNILAAKQGDVVTIEPTANLALLGRRLPSTWMASAFRRPRNLHNKRHRACDLF
jgi:hypothetical protein